MKEVTFELETALLTNKECCDLLSRFDIRNAKREGSHFTTRIACCLCMKFAEFGGACGKCPLTVFRIWGTAGPGCVRLIDTVAGGYIRYFNVSSERIGWSLRNKDNAERQVTNIRNFIKTFPETNKRRRL